MSAVTKNGRKRFLFRRYDAVVTLGIGRAFGQRRQVKTPPLEVDLNQVIGEEVSPDQPVYISGDAPLPLCGLKDAGLVSQSCDLAGLGNGDESSTRALISNSSDLEGAHVVEPSLIRRFLSDQNTACSGIEQQPQRLGALYRNFQPDSLQVGGIRFQVNERNGGLLLPTFELEDFAPIQLFLYAGA